MVLQNALWLDFPADAAEFLDKTARKLWSDPLLAQLLAKAEDALFDVNVCKTELLKILASVAEKTDVDPRTVDLTLLLRAVDRLRAQYREKGLPDTVCRETLRDLKYKHAECREVYGVDGIFVTDWFPLHFRCQLFALGRLQYERHAFEYDFYGSRLVRGDTVYKCHIPSCGPLTEESVLASFKTAYAFFADELRDGIMPIFCSSWMLYPPHDAEVFPAGSNLHRFYTLFDIMEAIPLPENEDFWRIFHTPFERSMLPNAPEGTSLQRAFKRFLQDGNDMGKGKGILLFDGDRILPKENS